jgi:NADH-quinone oxidoreductase subunit H
MLAFLSDPVNSISQWLQVLLAGWGASPGLVTFILSALGAGILALGSMLWVIFLIWYERKIIGRIQDRLGPNRVGPYGLFQPIADMLKIFTKEYITPIGADKFIYNLAPVLSVASIMMMWVVIPLAVSVYGANLNVGILYLIAVGGLADLAVIMAGWSSNNKYAMLGAFRVVAQLISYEVPMIMSLLVPVLLARSMNLNDIVKAQNPWFIFIAPVAALVFFITQLAEVGRAPFDLVEAESEIVAGFNIEYSGLKFGMFFVAEFMHAFTISLLFAVIFLGGWRGPGAEQYPILGFVYFVIKTMAVYLIVILFRGALPRLRIDQMMDLNWKVLTPLSLAMVGVTALVDKLVQGGSNILRIVSLLLINIAVLLITSVIMSVFTNRRQQKLDELADHNAAWRKEASA